MKLPPSTVAPAGASTTIAEPLEKPLALSQIDLPINAAEEAGSESAQFEAISATQLTLLISRAFPLDFSITPTAVTAAIAAFAEASLASTSA